jgi:hypothetical protein
MRLDYDICKITCMRTIVPSSILEKWKYYWKFLVLGQIAFSEISYTFGLHSMTFENNFGAYLIS